MDISIYLAGPIVGMTEFEANDWREDLIDLLSRSGIRGVSPLRCEPIRGERYDLGNEDERFGTARAIGSKNLLDVRTCDMTLAYIPQPEEGLSFSVGTIIELGWAHAFGKPTIVVTDSYFIRRHPVINACASWILPGFDQAIDVIQGVFGVYVGGLVRRPVHRRHDDLRFRGFKKI